MDLLTIADDEFFKHPFSSQIRHTYETTYQCSYAGC